MPSPTLLEEQITLTGVLERIVYANEENHYTIAELKPLAKKQKVTITGTFPGLQCGETLKLQGTWVTHPQYGDQFKVDSFESTLPADVYGIRKYLGSGLIPGIGPSYADKIVDHFQEETFHVISNKSARLKEIPGIGQQRARSIKQAWDDQQSLREVFLFLKTYGVSNNQCLKIVRKYGNEAVTVIRENPFQLARDIDGIGFKTADQIAHNLGLPSDGPQRLQAGLLFTAAELASNGHTCYLEQEFTQQAAQLLEVPLDKISDNLKTLLDEAELISLPHAQAYQLPDLQQAEQVIAQKIDDILKTPSKLPPILLDKAIEWAQDKAGFAFAPEQTQSIQTALTEKFSVITGGPGTGKTTLLQVLVKVLRAKKVPLTLAAPTGRAAQRMSESTGHEAKTIHRLLKFEPAKGTFLFHANNPLSTHFIVIDEASMLDTTLASVLLAAIPDYAHVVFVGDIHQLPSVGPGSVLRDILTSHTTAQTTLSQIFRQGKTSSIVTTAHNILSGSRIPPETSPPGSAQDPTKDLEFIYAPDPHDCLAAIDHLHTHVIPKELDYDPLTQAQVLAPLHKGTLGIHNLNLHLKQTLNPLASKKASATYSFQPGDKVIQTRNNYDENIFNGDLGIIQEIDTQAQKMTVAFDEQTVTLERMDWMDLALAYSISIHKSQGSEFPVVVIPLLKQYFIMLKRNLLYTAITRGKKKVFLVGDTAAYSMAVRAQETNLRQTNLTPLLQGTTP